MRSFFESIVETVRQPLLVLDNDRRVVSANSCFCAFFRLRPKQIAGELLTEMGEGAWNIPQLNELLEDVLPRNNSFVEFKVVHEFPKVGRKVLLLNGRQLEREQGLPNMILLAMEDVTDKHET